MDMNQGLTDEALRRLQQVQYDILKAIHEVCSKHNLKYYITYGTLIGAVRHKGFIPWDDDVDVAMYREDYEKFCQVAQEEMGDAFFLQTWRTDPGYPRFRARVRKNGTRAVQRVFAHLDMHQGIWVTIFPLDRVKTSGGWALMARGRLTEILSKLYEVKKGVRKPSRFEKLLSVIMPVVRLLPDKFFGAAVEFLSKLSNADPNSQFTVSFTDTGFWRRFILPNSVYGEGEMLQFEDGWFRAPKEQHVLLTTAYGDYRQLPPPERRKPGHVMAVEFE